MPFYIPVLIQGLFCLLFLCVDGKKHCQQPGYSQGEGSLLGKQSWYKPHLLRVTMVLKKTDCCRQPHVLDLIPSRGSQHTNHSESRAESQSQPHTSQT